ncbi:MAG: hypothetical protein QNL33_17510 [Akkermansiaceae bacterium]|jgi:purine-cytosine permease-like protein
MADTENNQSNEYERTPVPKKALKGPGKFWGMYAGEHAAGTEFMIGPLFLAAGASLSNLLVGLLIGNILAILTWRYLVVPIAMNKRMTIYYQLERIAGGKVVKIYNLVNGLLFCFLAGCMVTVSAAAIGVPFGIFYDTPAETFGLGAPSFTILVLVVGSVMAIIAAAGYETVARVANVAAPWMIGVFAACGFVALYQIGATSDASLSDGKFWTDAVAFVQEKNGPGDFGFWKIVIFSWLCNGAMHFGMADLSIFRYAKDKSSGWAPAIGMFLGHYMAWICAALLLAALIHTNPAETLNSSGQVQADPGRLAWYSLGWVGIVCVVIAGWTTANPTVYRAGLAFQGMVPGSKTFTMTLVAGIVATIAGIFPNLSGQLLGFVGAYGCVLGPMGAILFVDFWFLRKENKDELATRTGSSANWIVLVSWLLPVAIGLHLIFREGAFAAFLVIPCWIGAGVLYFVLNKFFNKA